MKISIYSEFYDFISMCSKETTTALKLKYLRSGTRDLGLFESWIPGETVRTFVLGFFCI